MSFGEVKLDAGKMQDWKSGIVKKLTGGVRGLLKANGATLIEGFGKFVDAKTLEVTAADGSYSLEVPAKRSSDGAIVADDVTLRADAAHYLTFPRAPRTAIDRS